MKAKVLVARFPGKLVEHPASSNWAWETILKAKKDPRIEAVYNFDKADTPITMVRNDCVNQALDLDVDVLVMVDNDMRPDCEPDGKPFWDTAFDFWWVNRNAPMVIGAPYVGPPPLNNVYVFTWENRNNYDPQAFHLPQYTRAHAAMMAGIQPCSALPTGVIMYCDLKNLMKRKPEDPGPGQVAVKDKGWFYYEWTDATCSRKASTEDVTNTRDIGILLAKSGIEGAGVYCNWDSWAAHIKPQEFGKPRPMVNGDVSEVFREALSNDVARDERMMHLDRKFPQVGEVAV